MRLRGPQPIERKPKAVSVLSPELLAEGTLNEQIGLTKQVENRLRNALEEQITHWDQKFYLNQVATACSMVTLFPEEADIFIQHYAVDKVIRSMRRDAMEDDFLAGWSYVKRMSPEKVKKVPSGAEGALKIYMQLARDRNDPFVLEEAANLITLFPKKTPEIKIKIDRLLVNTLKELGDQKISMVLSIMRRMLLIDPAFHREFHKFALQHKDALRKFLEEFSLKTYMPTKETAELFATLKLVLAEKIRILPSGILVAVEQPKIMGNTKPLPERSLA